MTAVFHHHGVGLSPSRESLPAELIDQLAEALALPAEAHTRSVVVASLAAEIFETIRWLSGRDPDQEELASLYKVLAEAYAHRSRMAARTTSHQRR